MRLILREVCCYVPQSGCILPLAAGKSRGMRVRYADSAIPLAPRRMMDCATIRSLYSLRSFGRTASTNSNPNKAMAMTHQLDKATLMDACSRMARKTMWANRPVDTDNIQSVARSLYDIALDHEEYIVEAGRDPNLLRSCVEYLETTHAIPPMMDDTRWFRNMLSALVELAVPNSVVGERSEELFREIELGIAESRSSYQPE